MAISRRGYQPKKRNTGIRERKRIVLLATEGNNKTETLYFRKFPTANFVVRFARGNYTDPVNMINALSAEYEENCDPSEGDIGYCLIDADTDPAKNRKIEMADGKSNDHISVIVSAPCFEIWYLCHFTASTHQYTSNEEVLSTLRRYIPNYRKESAGIAELIADKTDEAIANAQRLEKHCLEKGACAHTVSFSPSTEIYKIVSLLKK